MAECKPRGQRDMDWTSIIISSGISVLATWACARLYYAKQVRSARLAEAAADSRYERLMEEMLRVSDAVRPDDLVQRTADPVVAGGEPVTDQGESVTVTSYERLAETYDAIGAPIMAGIVRKAGELDRYESMTLEDAYREGLIEPDPESYR